MWLSAWHYGQIPLSVVLMLSLLGLLIAIYLRWEPARTRVSPPRRGWCACPFSIYLGWITVATVANVTDLLWRWAGAASALGPSSGR